MRVNNTVGPVRLDDPYPRRVKLKYVVEDNVKVQVINDQDNKIIREVPRKLSSKIIQQNAGA